MSSSEEVGNPATMDSSGSESEDGIWSQEPLKKRASDPSQWKKNIAKRKRDSGEAYVGVGPTKRHMEAKTLGPPCTCPRKCYDAVGADNAQLIFKNYWKMASHNAQTSYLVNLVNTSDVKKCYAGPDSRRKKTHEYSVLVNNKKVVVCKTAFCNIHAISARRVLYAVNKLRETGVTPVDKRGTARSVNRTPDDNLQLVHDHIKSLPTCSSHYSQAKRQRRVYLPPGYSQQACYDLYVKMCTEKGVTDKQVKLEKYKSVMRSYNISVDPSKPVKRRVRPLSHPSLQQCCNRWVQNCGREDLRDKSVEYLHDNIKLCSLHFEPSQYHPNSKRLKQNAVPTVFNVPNAPNPVTTKRVSHECPGLPQMKQNLSAEKMELFIKEELPDVYNQVAPGTAAAKSFAISDEGFEEAPVQEYKQEYRDKDFLTKKELDIKEEPLIDRVEHSEEEYWSENLSAEATGLLSEARISNEDGQAQIKHEYDLDESGGHIDNEVSHKRKRRFSQVDEAIEELEKVSSKHNLSQLVEGVLKYSKNPRTAFAHWVSVKVAELPEPLWNGFQEEIFSTVMRYREMARRQTQQP